ncbi:MAG: response regulator [Acidobacteriota bacterium]
MSKVKIGARSDIQNEYRPKVLIIDDDATSIEVLKYNLQQAGYKVAIHTKNLGMIAAINDERPDLILLDINMPLLDGPLLCRLVKKNQQFAQTPILLCSALNEKRLIKKAAECKATGYIYKGWGIKQVIKKVGQYLASS